MISIQETAAFPVNDVYGSEILRFASGLLDPQDRGSSRVTETAVPLLEWAQAALDRGDLRRRYEAMARAHVNTQAGRLHAPRRLTPAEFLAETGVYYGFMTGAAA